MAYGERLGKLNPLSDEYITALLQSDAPDAAALLDLACGRGDRLRALELAFPEFKLCGIDLDRANAEIAADVCAGAEILVGDAASLPYADGSFDAVLCECSFSLFDRPEDCAAEIARVLRPGGVLLLGDLYARRDSLSSAMIERSRTIRMIYGREALERFFLSAGLTPDGFDDHSGDLAQMLGQMVLDGVLCDCLEPDTLAEMKRLGTGYGLWLFQKQN